MPEQAPETAITTAKLPGKLKAFITRETDTLSDDEPIYAINWFNTKQQWVYDFYNVLAVRAVKKVGGAPFFKGKYIKTLHGDEAQRRDILLVVRYPAIRAFSTMLENWYFLLVSLVRIAAVDEFTFGLTKRSDKGADLRPRDSSESKNAAYGVHHFKSSNKTFFELQDLITTSSVELFYAGQIRARLATGQTPDTCASIICLMDGMVILRGEDPNQIEDVMNSAAYKSLIDKTETSFSGLYGRIL